LMLFFLLPPSFSPPQTPASVYAADHESALPLPLPFEKDERGIGKWKVAPFFFQERRERGKRYDPSPFPGGEVETGEARLSPTNAVIFFFLFGFLVCFCVFFFSFFFLGFVLCVGPFFSHMTLKSTPGFPFSPISDWPFHQPF